jgi:hypothetical protein
MSVVEHHKQNCHSPQILDIGAKSAASFECLDGDDTCVAAVPNQRVAFTALVSAARQTGY